MSKEISETAYVGDSDLGITGEVISFFVFIFLRTRDREGGRSFIILFGFLSCSKSFSISFNDVCSLPCITFLTN